MNAETTPDVSFAKTMHDARIVFSWLKKKALTLTQQSPQLANAFFLAAKDGIALAARGITSPLSVDDLESDAEFMRLLDRSERSINNLMDAIDPILPPR